MFEATTSRESTHHLGAGIGELHARADDSRLAGDRPLAYQSYSLPIAASVFSVSLHAVALLALWFTGVQFASFPTDESRQPAGQALTIGLRAQNPFRTRVGLDASEASLKSSLKSSPESSPESTPESTPDSTLESTREESAASEPLDAGQDEAVAELMSEPTPAVSDLNERTVLVAPAISASPEAGEPRLIVAPSTLVVKQALDEALKGREALRWRRRCTAQQEESALLDCEESRVAGAARGFDAAVINPITRALVPQRVRTRSERTVPTLASGVDEVRANLARTSSPTGINAYVMEEIEAGISFGSSSENRTIKRMERMVDKSAAGAMADRILSDPWLQNAAREARDRKVVD